MNEYEISILKARLNTAESHLEEAEKNNYFTLQGRIERTISLIKDNIYILENPIT